MTFLEFLQLIPALLGLSADQPREQEVVRSVVVHDEWILRVPVRPRVIAPIEWVEHKGPKCIDAGRIAGAVLSGEASVDFLMKDRQRFRAEVDSDCLGLDFYKGFYLQPDDDRVCARRETIRSRIGGSCRIERFRMLEPRLKR